MTRRNSRKIAVLLLTVSVAVAACKKEDKPVSVAVKPPPKTAQNQSTSAKVAVGNTVQKQASSSRMQAKGVQLQTSTIRRVAVASTNIDFSGKKDPFKPYIVQPVTPVKKESAPGRNKNALPIESYDVNKFKLVGIVAGLKENRALIVDPLRKGYVVKEGMQLGNNNGRITRISGDTLEVLEQFRDDSGILRKRTVRLVLPQKK